MDEYVFTYIAEGKEADWYELKDTKEWMVSRDKLKKMASEYVQLSLRIKELRAKIGTDDLKHMFRPVDPFHENILNMQLEYMSKYKAILELRIKYLIEGGEE